MAADPPKTGKGWKAFLQNTSFHGVRYIAPDSESDVKKGTTVADVFRRGIWLLFVVGAITLFVYQVADRAKAYFRHDTNINVELIYVEELDFPAVTVCNQNTFRLTKSVDWDMYKLVSDVFSPMTAEDIKSRHSNFSALNSDDFMFATAHTRYDFINRCTWNNSNCNITRDIRQRMTDFGVCYTFNFDADKVLPVQQSGASFGLSLLLNIEQYEYMKGPQNDAGVKILLHDQKEEPLMKDLGFAVAPGSHTLVGVKNSVIKSLEPPWGKCEMDAQPYASCKVSCSGLAMRNQCCTRTKSSITNVTDVVCDDLNYFVCVYNDLDTKQLQTSNCHCEIPCHRTVYEPSMSYAQLSKYTADQLILRDADTKAELTDKFLRAKETAQRVVPEMVEYNNIKFEALLTSVRRYTEALGDIILAQSDTTTNGSAINVPQVLGKVLAADEDTTLARVADRDTGLYYIGKFELHDYGFTSWVREIEDRVLDMRVAEINTHDVTGYQLVIVLEICINETGFQPAENVTTEFCLQSGWTETADSRVWRESMKRVDSSLGRAPYILGLVDYHTAHYPDVIAMYYGERPIKGEEHLAQHQKCLDRLELFETSVNGMIAGLTALQEAITVAEALEAAHMVIQNIGYYYDTVAFKISLDPCQWMHDTLFKDLGKDDYEAAAANWDRPFTEVTQQFEVMVTTTLNLNQNFEDNLERAANNIEKYRHFNLSFYDLSDVMTSKDIMTAMDEFIDLQSAYNAMVTLLVQYFTDVFEPSLLEMYTFLLNTSVPLFYDETIQDFQIVELARQWKGGPDVVQRALALLKSDPTTAAQMIISALIPAYQEQTLGLKNNLQRLSGDISLAMADLQSHLTDYMEEAQVNEKFFMDNFLQVDIFYKQLSFEKVTQQKAFEFLSLLSEVGGFMGLLLGASVLTVCELFDHIVISAKRSCRSETEKPSSPSSDAQ